MKILLTLACVALTLSACNTAAGVGKDIEKAGTSIQKAVTK